MLLLISSKHDNTQGGIHQLVCDLSINGLSRSTDLFSTTHILLRNKSLNWLNRLFIGSIKYLLISAFSFSSPDQ